MTRRILVATLIWTALIWVAVAFAAEAPSDPRCPRCVVYRAHGQTVFLPNDTLTPGAFDPTLTREAACKPERLRQEDRRNGPAARKRAVYAAYGVKYVPGSGRYEVDHRCPVKLCGDNSERNLWIQPYTPRPGAHEKDRLEVEVIRRTCVSKELTLAEAQRIFLEPNWYEAYRRYVLGAAP